MQNTAASSPARILTGSQRALIGAFDWGPVVVGTILDLESEILPASVRAEDLTVSEKKESFDFALYAAGQNPLLHIMTESPRTVKAAYACTQQGEPATQPTRHIRIELEVAPREGMPFCYDLLRGKNNWCDPYLLQVLLAENAALAYAGGAPVGQWQIEKAIDFGQAMIPALAPFNTGGRFTGSDGRTLAYAWHEPAGVQKAPLVIWLHGAGEGGTQPSIALLGNKVTALAGQPFQQAMGGAAYLLVPQTDRFWLEWDPGHPGSWAKNMGEPSVYTTVLKELIDSFVAAHPGVDTSRIYIGGCSNGGYMTVNMALRYPGYFAAAFPICEAYRDSGITDGELQALAGLPIWFVYAQNDHIVPPEDYAVPTIARLRAISSQVRASVFANVQDTTGLYTAPDGGPWQYSGHWSWVYFFNDQCRDEATGEGLWQWLG